MAIAEETVSEMIERMKAEGEQAERYPSPGLYITTYPSNRSPVYFSKALKEALGSPEKLAVYLFHGEILIQPVDEDNAISVPLRNQFRFTGKADRQVNSVALSAALAKLFPDGPGKIEADAVGVDEKDGRPYAIWRKPAAEKTKKKG